MRGIAAVVVMLHHMAMVAPALYLVGEHPSRWLAETPLRILLAGPACVVLFFVLSGFVLTIAVNHSTASSTTQLFQTYLIKRICRIWLPFAAACVFAALLGGLVRGTPILNIPCLGSLWSHGITPSVFLQNLFMTGSDASLDPVQWSLIVELQISLIFPLLLFVVRRQAPLCVAVSMALLFAVAKIRGLGVLPDQCRTLEITTAYIFCFVVGIVLANARQHVSNGLASLKPAHTVWGIALALAVFCAPLTRADQFDRMSQAGMIVMISIAACALMGFAIVPGKLRRLLEHTSLTWLGKISFSLYLIHMPIMAAACRLIGSRLPAWQSVVIGAVIAVMAAAVMQRVIEAPSAILGHRLAQRLARTGRREVSQAA